jgi:predicted permease
MPEIERLFRRLRALFQRVALEREMEEEIRLHVELETDELVRTGVHRDEARRQALVSFGGVERTKEEAREARGFPWLSVLLSDLKVAVRSAVRQPAFPAVVIGTLALGIGANTAMFGLIHSALLKPLPYDDPERLVQASATIGGQVNPWASLPNIYDYRAQTTSFETLAVIASGAGTATVTGDGARPERIATTTVSHDLFRTLGVATAAGRWFAPDEGVAGASYVVLVSERLARRRFGAASSAIGRTLALTGVAPQGVAATVVGVMPATFRFFDDVDVWLPIRSGEGDGPETRIIHDWLAVGRLRRGVSLEAAQRQVDVVSARLQRTYPETNKVEGLRLDPLQAALFGSSTPKLLRLLGAVGLVLLIACANVAGLLLARGAARRNEIAMRAALGASRGRLVGQLLSESLLLTGVAGVVGVAVAFWLQRLLPIGLGLEEFGVAAGSLNLPVLLFAAAVSGFTALLVGIVPAVRLSEFGTAGHVLSGVRATEAKAGTRLRSLLVVAQIAASLTLLVGAGVLIRSFAQLLSTDVGFDAQGVLTGEIALPYEDADRRLQFYDGLREDVAALPGVSAVALTTHVPLRDQGGNPPVWTPEHPPVDASEIQPAFRRTVSPGYFSALRMPLIAGRDFARSDRLGSPPVAVVNQLMARTLFPGQPPLGKHVMMMSAPGMPPIDYEVVGVIGDARIEAVATPPRMTMYISLAQRSRPTMQLLVRTGQNPDLLARTIRRLVAARDANIPFESLVSLERLAGDSLRSDRVVALTLTLFSLVALLLASLGLYGVLSYYVSQRTPEIGVRMALGADRAMVLRHVLGRSGAIVLPGLVLGLGVSLAGTRLLSHLFADMPPADPATVLTATAALALVAAAASAWPAWRAASIDPVQAIRGE